jgi:hypothetical protein
MLNNYNENNSIKYFESSERKNRNTLYNENISYISK